MASRCKSEPTRYRKLARVSYYRSFVIMSSNVLTSHTLAGESSQFPGLQPSRNRIKNGFLRSIIPPPFRRTLPPFASPRIAKFYYTELSTNLVELRALTTHNDYKNLKYLMPLETSDKNLSPLQVTAKIRRD